MKKKTIIGLIGDDKLKSEVIEFLVKEGFWAVSIMDKVRELSKLLMKNYDYSENDLALVRLKGYSVHKLYWINLVLASVPNNKVFVVIKDIDEKDAIHNVIDIYYVGEGQYGDGTSNHVIRSSDQIEVKLKNILPSKKNQS